MQELIRAIERFKPYNEQEKCDRREFLRRLKGGEKLLTRDNKDAHLTASAWVVSYDRRHALMAYHDIYDSWAWLGGHADGQFDLMAAAIREVMEESGLAEDDLRVLSDDIYSLEILTVDGHEKNGSYVSSHLHLNITYLMEADMTKPLHARKGENSGVRWFGLNEAINASSEPWFRERIYKKLNEKLGAFAESNDDKCGKK